MIFFISVVLLRNKHCGDHKLLNPGFNYSTRYWPFPFTGFGFKGNHTTAGKGHYSFVRVAQLDDGRTVAVKEYKIFMRSYLVKELMVLKALDGVPNTVRVIGLTGNKTNPVVVYSYHKSTPDAYNQMNLERFRWWLKEVLTTLAEAHARGIYHRDIKLENILVDFEGGNVTIIDWGLADFYSQKMKKTPRVGTIRVKSPEMAMEYPFYDCETDIWSLGIACLDLMFGFSDFWNGKTNGEMIQLMTTYFQSTAWNKAAAKLNKSYIIKPRHSHSIFELAMPPFRDFVTEDSLDLVRRMLEIDPTRRISAADALNHKFFQ